MGKIWMPGGGGGGASSDDCTLMRAAVPKGLTAVTADSDDEALEGTLDTEATLSDSQALSGQTYLKFNPQTKLFEKRIGDMANKGAWNGSVAMNGTVTIPAGYHNGSGKVTGPAITNRGNYGGTGNSRGNDAPNQRMWVKVPGGYYNENAQVFLNWADIRSMAGLTPDKIKKNVSIMGITGTHDGFVPGPMDIYNRGAWGTGYGMSDIIGFTGNSKDETQTKLESSSIKFKYIKRDISFSGKHSLLGCFKTKPINFSPYKSINFIVSRVQGISISNKIVEWQDVKLRAYIYSSDGNSKISSKDYYYGGKTSNGISDPSGEVTSSIDLSNINITGNLTVELYSAYDGHTDGMSAGEFHEAYVHRIWFS